MRCERGGTEQEAWERELVPIGNVIAASRNAGTPLVATVSTDSSDHIRIVVEPDQVWRYGESWVRIVFRLKAGFIPAIHLSRCESVDARDKPGIRFSP